MSRKLAIASVCVACAVPAVGAEGQGKSGQPIGSLPHEFDLARTLPEDGRMATDRQHPISSTLREPKPAEPDFKPPSLAVQLAEDGPILAMGAMGAKFKDAPRLAHIAIGMDF
mgnify:CR=1 FL=1|tara:strand:- start:1011 stop:1349 length:339 start_codon:yes stop_codon:yes gene_type:complete